MENFQHSSFCTQIFETTENNEKSTKLNWTKLVEKFLFTSHQQSTDYSETWNSRNRIMKQIELCECTLKQNKKELETT